MEGGQRARGGDIITKKQAKYVKEKLALSEGFAYKWTDRSNSRRGPPKTLLLTTQNLTRPPLPFVLFPQVHAQLGPRHLTRHANALNAMRGPHQWHP